MLGKLAVFTCRGTAVRLGRLRLRRSSLIIQFAVLVISVVVVKVIGSARASGLVIVVRLGRIVETGNVSVLNYRPTITDERRGRRGVVVRKVRERARKIRRRGQAMAVSTRNLMLGPRCGITQETFPSTCVRPSRWAPWVNTGTLYRWGFGQWHLCSPRDRWPMPNERGHEIWENIGKRLKAAQ